jgi:hypothetical protein
MQLGKRQRRQIICFEQPPTQQKAPTKKTPTEKTLDDDPDY